MFRPFHVSKRYFVATRAVSPATLAHLSNGVYIFCIFRFTCVNVAGTSRQFVPNSMYRTEVWTRGLQRPRCAEGGARTDDARGGGTRERRATAGPDGARGVIAAARTGASSCGAWPRAARSGPRGRCGRGGCATPARRRQWAPVATRSAARERARGMRAGALCRPRRPQRSAAASPLRHTGITVELWLRLRHQ